MEVDTNGRLYRIGAVLRLISNKMDRLIEIGERVEGQVRLPSEEESKTVADVLMDGHCIPSDAVADEPPKKWRILEPGEVVQEGDLMNSKLNPPSDPPSGGWLPASSFYFGREASFFWGVYFARPVADEPAKEAEHPAEPMLSVESYRPVDDGDIGKIVEVQNSPADPWRECTLIAIDWYRPFGFICRHSDPAVVQGWCFARIKIDEPAKEAEPEHPAGPKPDPGEGYRILSKNPPEDLQPGDEYEPVAGNGRWVESENAHTNSKQGLRIWYRRKIEPPKPPEPEYREPVLPGDAGKACEFSLDGNEWVTDTLIGFSLHEMAPWESKECLWEHARIKKDA